MARNDTHSHTTTLVLRSDMVNLDLLLAELQAVEARKAKIVAKFGRDIAALSSERLAILQKYRVG